MTNQKLSPAKFTLLGFQHMFAMFGATVLVPTLTGLSVSATLLFAGLGTLLFHLITGGKVPAFLGSSFAFLGGYAAVKAMPQFADGTMNWIPYAGVGVAVAGLIYVVVAGLFKIFGAQKVMRFFPPIVTGPIIICIGMILANSAINNCSNNWLIAILAVVIVVAFNIWGKGMFKIIPILLGVVGSYAVAAVTGQVDFTPVKEAAWLGLPFQWKDTAFSLFGGCDGTLLLNGPQGISGTPNDSTFLIGAIMLMLTLIIAYNFINSRTGRAVMSIRDNVIAAQSVGLNITKYKLITFALTAFLAGTAGALYSHNFYTLQASKFDYNLSILILVFVVLGGIGNIRGSVIAAGGLGMPAQMLIVMVLVLLPEMLRAISSYRMLIYAVILIVMMIITSNEKSKAFIEANTQKFKALFKRGKTAEAKEAE